MKKYRRRGFSLVKALLMILIVAIVLIGIMDAMISALHVELNSEGHVETDTTANAFFMMLEEYRGERNNRGKELNEALGDTMGRLGAVAVKKGNEDYYTLRAMKLQVEETSPDIVTLTIEHAAKKAIRTKNFTYSLNPDLEVLKTPPARNVSETFSLWDSSSKEHIPGTSKQRAY